MDQDIEFIRARIDEQGRILNEHGETISNHGEAIKGLVLVVYGNQAMRVTGLLERQEHAEKFILETTRFRDDIAAYWKGGKWVVRVLLILLTPLSVYATINLIPLMQELLGILP